ncbi:MAG: site-2 protease family protein [Rubripirellula sp.]
MNRRLKLGTFLGIGLYVHWTFALVIAYVALSAYGDGAGGMLYAVLQLFGVFTCVTLHEYGHATAAKQFDIDTVDITLLPIGGVARLQSMPRIPWQELVVAIAGPAVNVVIVFFLVLGFFVFSEASVLYALTGYVVSAVSGRAMDDQMIITMMEIFTTPSIVGFAVLMLVVNMMLILFNMIPAFPMDGGRVFRSLLAMVMNYRRATMIASRVGLVCAAAMAFLALSATPPNPIPVLIAAFIGYAGLAEARQVDVMESVRGLTVGQAMIATNVCIPMDMPLANVIRVWRSIPMPALPVVSTQGIVVGMLHLSDLNRSAAEGKDPQTPAGELVNHADSVGVLRESEELESALMRTGRQRRQIPVVNDSGILRGILDLDSMLLRGEVSKLDFSPLETTFEPTSADRFDQTN